MAAKLAPARFSIGSLPHSNVLIHQLSSDPSEEPLESGALLLSMMWVVL